MVHHPTMKAYSLDLREKIVDAVLRRGMSKAQAARTFGVGATSVKRYVKLQEEGKPLSPGKAPGKKGKLGQRGIRSYSKRIFTPDRPSTTNKEPTTSSSYSASK